MLAQGTKSQHQEITSPVDFKVDLSPICLFGTWLSFSLVKTTVILFCVYAFIIDKLEALYVDQKHF